MKKITTLGFFTAALLIAALAMPSLSWAQQDNSSFEAEMKKLEQEMKKLEQEMKSLEKEMESLDHSNFEFDFDFDYNTMIGSCAPKTFLGIYPGTPKNTTGVLVTGVVDDSGAKAAGLEKGDIIKSIDGNEMKNSSELSGVLAKFEPNENVVIRFERDGQLMQTVATLTEKGSSRRDPCKVFIGVTLSGQGPDGKGTRITSIIDDTPADASELERGDIILKLDGVETNSFDQLLRERNKHNPGDEFTLTILRESSKKDVKARFKSCDETKPEVIESVPQIINESPTENDNTTDPPLPVEERKDREDAPAPNGNGLLELSNWNIFPNPTYGKFFLRFNGDSVPTTIRVIDSNGKEIYKENINNFDGTYNKKIDLKAAPGTLFVQVQQGDKMVTEKIILMPQA